MGRDTAIQGMKSGVRHLGDEPLSAIIALAIDNRRFAVGLAAFLRTESGILFTFAKNAFCNGRNAERRISFRRFPHPLLATRCSFRENYRTNITRWQPAIYAIICNALCWRPLSLCVRKGKCFSFGGRLYEKWHSRRPSDAPERAKKDGFGRPGRYSDNCREIKCALLEPFRHKGLGLCAKASDASEGRLLLRPAPSPSGAILIFLGGSDVRESHLLHAGAKAGAGIRPHQTASRAFPARIKRGGLLPGSRA